jgi:hypothetical protein
MTLGESPAAGGQEGVETNTMTKSRSLLLIAALAPVTLMLQSTYVCAQPATAEVPAVRRASPPSEKEKINAWSVGLAGGLLEGPPIRLAAEMARVVDDGPNLHVLPIVTRGPTENVNSLLYLRGVDTAIINSDAFEEYKLQAPRIRSRISYCSICFRRSCTSSSDRKSRACRISRARK